MVSNFVDKKKFWLCYWKWNHAKLASFGFGRKIFIRKFEKCKVYTSFKDNIWGVDWAGMQLNIGIHFLLCVIDIYSKYAWVVPLKENFTITNALQNILDESNRHEAKSEGRKPNRIWVYKSSEFYNRSMKFWL